MPSPMHIQTMRNSENTEINSSDSDWHFIANNSSELANIGNKLLNASRPTLLDEQWQMSKLLTILSSASILKFQVRVRHIGEKAVPDFQIESDGRRIAIELAKVAVQDVEHARALQGKGLKRTLSISGLYRKRERPRTRTEVIKEGFSKQTWTFGVSVQELEKILT